MPMTGKTRNINKPGKRKASARPLIPGGSNYTAMHLVFQPQTIRIKPSYWCYFFAGLLLLPGLLSLYILSFIFFHHDGDLLFIGITVLLLAGSGFLAYFAVRIIRNIRKRCLSFFDLSSQTFYPEGYNSRIFDRQKLPAIPFSELDSLQIVEEYCSTGKNSFTSYELNLVLRDGKRFNLLDHSNKECFAEEAERLSEILSIPLTDAQGKRLSCDSFLALPVNIRENLLYCLFSFLLFTLFFSLGDGRAWYLTRKSFHWEKTPALVASAKIRKHSGKRTTYSLDLHYLYTYHGKKYSGSCYSFFDMRSSEYAVKEMIRGNPPGKKFFCYVNPHHPAQTVADRNIPPVWEMMLHSPWTSCFLIMGIFFMLKAGKQYHLLKKRAEK